MSSDLIGRDAGVELGEWIEVDGVEVSVEKRLYDPDQDTWWFEVIPVGQDEANEEAKRTIVESQVP